MVREHIDDIDQNHHPHVEHEEEDLPSANVDMGFDWQARGMALAHPRSMNRDFRKWKHLCVMPDPD